MLFKLESVKWIKHNFLWILETEQKNQRQIKVTILVLRLSRLEDSIERPKQM